jgi:hypothetical protein
VTASTAAEAMTAGGNDADRHTAWRYTAKIWTVAIGAWLCGAVVFFRVQWLSGFDRVSGSDGDGRLIIYLHEHLFRWLSGAASFTSPQMFYPVPGVLGYSDAFLLNLPAYAALRAAGIDPFLSHQLTLVLLAFLGYATFIGLLRYAFRIRYSVAIVAGLLFVFSNIMFLKQLHSQLFAVYYLPGIGLLALWALNDFPRLGLRLLGGVAVAALLYALLFSTSYYTAWNAGVVTFMGAIPAIVLLRKTLTPFLSVYRRPLFLVMASAFVAFAIGLIPFAIIYGPLIHSGVRRAYLEALSFAPFPQDIVNVSPWNLVWGGLLSRIPEKYLGHWEAISSVTPAVAIATLLGAWSVWRGRLIDWKREPYSAAFVIAAAFSFLISWLLFSRIGKYSAYWLVWHLVPGATGIRAAWRIGLIINFTTIAALALVLDRFLNGINKDSILVHSRRALLVSLFLAYCVIEQINTLPVAQISRSRQLRDLAAIPPPPHDCKAFFVEPVDGIDFNSVQISAMLISQRVALLTLNGSSGYFPRGWSYRLPPAYHEHVREWMVLHQLGDNVCSLTLPRGPWRPLPSAQL